MKRMRGVIASAFCLAIVSMVARANIFGPYEGFDDMFKRSEAIVVARTPPAPMPLNAAAYDPRSYDPTNGTIVSNYHMREVKILRTIKGAIPENTQQLINIGFFPVDGPPRTNASSSATGTTNQDARQALDRIITDEARKNDKLHIVPQYDTDFLLFLIRNDMNPQEPARWLTINMPATAIILKKGAYEAARKEQEKISAISKEKQSGKTQADKDRAARQEIIRLIKHNLDANSTSVQRQIAPLLEK